MRWQCWHDRCRVAELTHYTATGLRQAYRIAAYRIFVALSGSSAPKRPNKTNDVRRPLKDGTKETGHDNLMPDRPTSRLQDL
jgi:hypothetical protein